MNSWIVPVIVFVTIFVAWKLWTAYRSPEQLRRIAEALQRGAPLIDVRTPMEFASGHLPNAVNLPLGSFGPEASALGDKSVPVVVYCASGSRSAFAARMLRKAGFDVFDLGPMANGQKLPALQP